MHARTSPLAARGAVVPGCSSSFSRVYLRFTGCSSCAGRRRPLSTNPFVMHSATHDVASYTREQKAVVECFPPDELCIPLVVRETWTVKCRGH